MKLFKILGTVCLIAVLTMTACSNSNDNANEDAASADGEITIEYWQYDFRTKVDLMDELIKEFEEENPGIKVVQQTFPYEQYNQQVATMMPAGKGPDVINLYNGWAAMYIKNGYIQPLSKETFPHEMIEEEYFPFMEAVKVDGEYWMLPTAVRTLALFYNNDIFQEAGLDPESPPTTWDELVEYAQKTTKRDSNGMLETAGLIWEPDSQEHNWLRPILFLQAGADDLSDDNKTIMWDDSPAGLEAFEYWMSFPTTHEVSERGFMGDDKTAFGVGNAAMSVDGSFRIETLKNDFPDLNFDIAPLPSYKEEATMASFWGNAITKDVEGEKLEAAEKFLQFLQTPDVMERWLEAVGELPAKQEVAFQEKYIEDPLYGPFIEQLPIAYAHFFIDEQEERNLVVEAADQVLINGMDTEEAFKALVEKTQKLYDEYWNE